MCCAAALMAARLQMAKNYHDPIVPVSIQSVCDCLVLIKIWKVFVYSLSGYNARVIQAHYKHPNFIVRKTDHVLFVGESVRSLKLILRWMMNVPNIPQEYAKAPTRNTAPNRITT